MDEGSPIFAAQGDKSQWTAFGIFHDVGRIDGQCGISTAPPIFTNLSPFVDALSTIVVNVSAGGDIKVVANHHMLALFGIVGSIYAEGKG